MFVETRIFFPDHAGIFPRWLESARFFPWYMLFPQFSDQYLLHIRSRFVPVSTCIPTDLAFAVCLQIFDVTENTLHFLFQASLTPASQPRSAVRPPHFEPPPPPPRPLYTPVSPTRASSPATPTPTSSRASARCACCGSSPSSPTSAARRTPSRAPSRPSPPASRPYSAWYAPARAVPARHARIGSVCARLGRDARGSAQSTPARTPPSQARAGPARGRERLPSQTTLAGSCAREAAASGHRLARIRVKRIRVSGAERPVAAGRLLWSLRRIAGEATVNVRTQEAIEVLAVCLYHK